MRQPSARLRANAHVTFDESISFPTILRPATVDSVDSQGHPYLVHTASIDLIETEDSTEFSHLNATDAVAL